MRLEGRQATPDWLLTRPVSKIRLSAMALINATLIVQAIHFFIAYLLVKHFLFKPAVAEIQKEDAVQESLIATLQDHQFLLAQKEQELVQEKKRAQQDFSGAIPNLESSVVEKKMPSVVIPQFKISDLQETARQVSQQLITEVDHVR